MSRRFRPISRRSFLLGSGSLLLASRVRSRTAPAPWQPSSSASGPAFTIPDWVRDSSRMTFCSPDEIDFAADIGAQVVHTNAVWPYFPLRRDGGGLAAPDADRLRGLVAHAHRRGLRLVLGLPPFPPVELLKARPEWRVHPEDSDAALKIEPLEGNLATRIGCNLGPWGDYLANLLAELVRDYGLDGFSFDGNYHPPICFCPACKTAYRTDTDRDIPAVVSLDAVEYREYLVWRGERLESHVLALQHAIKAADPEAAIISWSANAGRYGHLLTSPRVMSTRLNLCFDMAMQEWWLDESNLGASIAPAFGAAYLRAVCGDGPCASEAYLMSRGSPYGTDSFPAQERLARITLNLTCGGVLADSLGWPNHRESARVDFEETRRREPWLLRTRTLPWAGMLVSEQTRQFFAYGNIPERFLPHVYGPFRAAAEEHLPLSLINDWEVISDQLDRFAVVLLPASAALSDAQVEALSAYVERGGGLVATAETSLCDELGRPRSNFALAPLFGVDYAGGGTSGAGMDPAYWSGRATQGLLEWTDHAVTADARLAEWEPDRSVNFSGPLVRVTEPANPLDAFLRIKPARGAAALPAGVARRHGSGHVVYLAAALDAALWSYGYPYQRRLLVRALEWASRRPAPIRVQAPMNILSRFYEQETASGRRTIIHCWNGIHSTGGHGLPSMETPLREEFVPVHGIRIGFPGARPRRVTLQPDAIELWAEEAFDAAWFTLPALQLHAMVVAEY